MNTTFTLSYQSTPHTTPPRAWLFLLLSSTSLLLPALFFDFAPTHCFQRFAQTLLNFDLVPPTAIACRLAVFAPFICHAIIVTALALLAAATVKQIHTHAAHLVRLASALLLLLTAVPLFYMSYSILFSC